MKNVSALLFFWILVIICIGCSDQKKLEGIWIAYKFEEYLTYAKYDKVRNGFDVKPNRNSKGLYLHRYVGNDVLYSKLDSIHFKYFYDTHTEGGVFGTYTANDSFYVCKEVDSCLILDMEYIDKNEMIQKYSKEVDYISKGDCNKYYRRLQKYKMQEHKDAIMSMLLSNPFRFDDEWSLIEFNRPHWDDLGYVVGDIMGADCRYEINRHWYLESIEDELFLVIDNKLIHITGFNMDVIYGEIHQMENTKIALNVASYQNEYSKESLLGEWSAINDSLVDFSCLSWGNKILSKTDVIQNKLNIVVKENSFEVVTNYYQDTLKWNINQFGNKIVFEEEGYNQGYYKYLNKENECFNSGNLWRIESLNDSMLVVRKLRNEYVADGIEIVTFQKNK